MKKTFDNMATDTIESIPVTSGNAVKFVNMFMELLGDGSAVLLTPMIPQTFLHTSHGTKPAERVKYAFSTSKLQNFESTLEPKKFSAMIQEAHQQWMGDDSPV